MSFDIFFQPCRYGATPVEQRDPSTGQIESVLPNEPLTDAELNTVRAVLCKATIHRRDESGCHVVAVDDGGEAEVYADNLDRGCMVALRGITPGLLQFLIDLLKAGNWSMVPAMEDIVAIVPSLECVKSVPDNFPRRVVCNSAGELGVLLSGGFDAWKKYRIKSSAMRGSRFTPRSPSLCRPNRSLRAPGRALIASGISMFRGCDVREKPQARGPYPPRPCNTRRKGIASEASAERSGTSSHVTRVRHRCDQRPLQRVQETPDPIPDADPRTNGTLLPSQLWLRARP